MHDVLRIPELFTNIFTFLNAPDLLSCALVCKLWHEDALIARWRVCNVTLKALLKRLSPIDGLDELGLVDEINGQNAHIRKEFKEISSEDWEVFLSTTAQVTHLHVTRLRLDPPSIELLQSLISTHGGELFPSLKSLELDFDAIEVPTVKLVLVPSLTTFKATSYGYDDLGPILYRLHPHAENINTVDLWMERGPSRFQVQSYPSLRTLKYVCKSFTGAAWTALGDAPLLETLEISVYMPEIPTITDVTFPSLKRLHMEDMEAGLTMALVLGSNMPMLERASIEEVPLRRHDQNGLKHHFVANSPMFKGVTFIEVEDTESSWSFLRMLFAIHPLFGIFLNALRFLIK